jgi:hypothetical protein
MFKRLLQNKGAVKVKMDAKQRIHAAICMLSLTVIALTTATYAWFTLSASTKVTELDLDVSAGANLRISTIDNGNDVEDYFDEVVSDNGGASDGSEINWWLEENYGVSLLADSSLPKMVLTPHTSGDGKNFYLQTANLNGGDPSEPNLTSGSYMEYELWFIAEKDMRVHLSTDSDEDGIWTHIEATDQNTSEQENIINCVRMSFECEDDDRTVVWEPYKNGTTTLKGQAAASEVETLELPDQDNMEYTDDTYICELTANEQKKVTVRVWVEGEDDDCTDEVQKSQFRTYLRFQGTDSDNNVMS